MNQKRFVCTKCRRDRDGSDTNHFCGATPLERREY